MSRPVLILTLAYPPSSAVGAFRAARFAKFLPELGWSPVVVTADSETSTVGRDDSRLICADGSVKVERTRPWGIPYSWKQSWIPTSNASAASPETMPAVAVNGATLPRRRTIRANVHRAIRAATVPFRIPDRHIWWAVPALRAMLRIVREHRPSVLLSTSPPHSTHLIALALNAMTGIPVVIDLRDPWARNRVDVEVGRSMHSIQNHLERFCIRRAKRVILNTPELLADFEGQYPAAWHEKFAVIPNGYDPLVRENIEARVRAAPTRTVDAPLRLCHAGTVYGRRDIRPLIEAVALLNRQGRRVSFEQIGSLANAADVAACVARNDAGEAVQLLGQRPHEEALRHMAAADILVVVRQNTGLQVPAKIYEMMLFGKPILALDAEGAVTRMVNDYQLGVVADPVDPAAIAAGILRAAEQLSAPPSEGRATALREFDARAQTRELANVLASAVESRHRARQ